MDPKVGIQKTNIGGDKHTFKDNEDTISLKYQSKRKSDQQWTFLVAFLSVKCWFLQRPVCFFKFIHVLFILNMAKLEVRLIMIGIQRIYTFHRTHLKQVKKLSPKLNKLSCDLPIELYVIFQVYLLFVYLLIYTALFIHSIDQLELLWRRSSNRTFYISISAGFCPCTVCIRCDLN